ncbi:MAG: hypothetical protein QOE61_4649 [Micromonosporaceae bacterium]|jgi:hypothetical protein|nr:hypothetical protein [Micromonosporaceae bacterium]
MFEAFEGMPAPSSPALHLHAVVSVFFAAGEQRRPDGCRSAELVSDGERPPDRITRSAPGSC